MLLKDVRQKLHRVRSEHAYVLICTFSRMLFPKCRDPLIYVLGHLRSDFHT